MLLGLINRIFAFVAINDVDCWIGIMCWIKGNLHSTSALIEDIKRKLKIENQKKIWSFLTLFKHA